jgi:hypothetical protein
MIDATQQRATPAAAPGGALGRTPIDDDRAAPLGGLLGNAAAELDALADTLRTVEAAVAALASAAPAEAAAMRGLQELDRAIQTAEALRGFIRALGETAPGAAIDASSALSHVHLGAVAEGLAGRRASGAPCVPEPELF